MYECFSWFQDPWGIINNLPSMQSCQLLDKFMMSCECTGMGFPWWKWVQSSAVNATLSQSTIEIDFSSFLSSGLAKRPPWLLIANSSSPSTAWAYAECVKAKYRTYLKDQKASSTFGGMAIQTSISHAFIQQVQAIKITEGCRSSTTAYPASPPEATVSEARAFSPFLQELPAPTKFWASRSDKIKPPAQWKRAHSSDKWKWASSS